MYSLVDSVVGMEFFVVLFMCNLSLGYCNFVILVLEMNLYPVHLSSWITH